MTALDTVRELHVLYGIAMTNRLTEPEPAISDVYAGLASDIHATLRWITAAKDVREHLRWLAAKWNDTANRHLSGERVAALYGSWAQNIKSIT